MSSFEPMKHFGGRGCSAARAELGELGCTSCATCLWNDHDLLGHQNGGSGPIDEVLLVLEEGLKDVLGLAGRPITFERLDALDPELSDSVERFFQSRAGADNQLSCVRVERMNLNENGGAKLDHRAANRSCFWAE